MSLHHIASRGAAVAALVAWAAPAGAGTEPTGVWVNDTGRGAIEIKDCGGKLCGHVVWTKDESDLKGCGKQIIGEAGPAGKGLWDGGWIYSPEKKRKYDVELKPLADGTLRVKGYAGTKIFSKTMIWTPAPADLVRCSTTQEAKAQPEAEAPKPALAAATASEAPSAAATAKTEPSKSGAQALAAKPDFADKPAPKAEASESKPPDNAEADKPATADPKPKDQVAAAEPEDDTAPDGGDGPNLDDLKNLEFGNGYGFKETGNGKCRLKVPYVTITIDCPE